MADVKSITVHGETYDIKDETARNSISTLNESVSTLESHDSQHTKQITALQTSISDNSGDIDTLQENLGSVTSRVTAAEGNISTLTTQTSGNTASISSLDGRMGSAESEISTLKTQMATKVTGDWLFNNYTPQTDQQIPLTPNFLTAYSDNFNASGGVYLITVIGLLMQGGQGNTEVMISVNGENNLIANMPTNENQYYSACTGIVNIPAGNNDIKVLLRNTNAPGALKAYSTLFITAVKIKNL